MYFQEVILLDELPEEILKEVETNPTDYDTVYNALIKADISGYFSKIESKIEQTHFAAKMVQNFFQVRSERQATIN